MPTATKTASNKPQTPFGAPPWAWNHIVPCGHATRERCRGIVTDAEREAGVKLIADYRASESTVLSNDIESRQHALTRLKGIPLELMKREIAACDFDKWTQAQAEVDRLRKEALELAETIFKRLIKSLDDQINETAIAAEQRLIDAGLPLRNGDSWLLHDDSLCRALWSQGRIADRTLAELTPDNAVGCIQWFCSGEPDVPFQWSALSYETPRWLRSAVV